MSRQTDAFREGVRSTGYGKPNPGGAATPPLPPAKPMAGGIGPDGMTGTKAGGTPSAVSTKPPSK